jgi:hypothetical protein
MPARVARTVLAATLLFGILTSSFPVATIASGPTCNLACCAGRAPHAAGSCMTGSCPAFHNAHIKKIHQHHAVVGKQTERLCGLSRMMMKATRTLVSEARTVDFGLTRQTESSQDNSRNASHQRRVSTTALGKPCHPDCGSCASGFSSSNRQRQTAALGNANLPRPPTVRELHTPYYVSARTLNPLSRQGAPRGPPSLFS